MNSSSSSPVAVGMRAIATVSLVALLEACGGGSSSDPCSSVAGETFALAGHVVDGRPAICSYGSESVVFEADGGAGGGRTWSQSGCSITVTSSTFRYNLVRDAGELSGTITAACHDSADGGNFFPDGGCADSSNNCLIDVAGTQGGP